MRQEETVKVEKKDEKEEAFSEAEKEFVREYNTGVIQGINESNKSTINLTELDKKAKMTLTQKLAEKVKSL